MLNRWFNKLLQPRKLRATDVLDERIRLESTSTAIGAIGVMLIAGIMYLLYPRDMPQAAYIGIWLDVQLLAGVVWLSFMVWHAHFRSPFTRQLWPYFSTVICSFYGFVWGAGWVFFVGTVDINHAQAAVIFTITLGGVFTGGILATIFHLPSLLSFTLCSLMPALISTFINESIFHAWFGVALVVYMLACTAFALNLNAFLMDTLEQREDKALLAQQLAIEKQRVEQVSQDKTRFLAAASHDLRQPLQALQFFQQSLSTAITQGRVVEQQRILDNMEASISALTSLLNTMLDISRLDAGTLPIQRQVFPLNNLFRRIYQQYESIASEAGLALRYIETCVQVESDPTHLERMLRNLVENAIKHMGRQGRILLGGRRCGGLLRIEVWDNGIGIPVHEQDAIFHEFYQLHNPERKRSRGFGLGLAIIKRTAAALGHNVRLRSQPGKGSVFSITVPIAAPPTTLPHTTNFPASTVTGDKPHGKILVIEDDETVLESLRTLLGLWGYTVIATNAPQPEEIASQYPDIAFIISDYQLSSGLNGVEVIQQIRQAAQWNIPALLITGNTSPLLAKELEKLGIPVSYKPINPQLFNKFIKNYN